MRERVEKLLTVKSLVTIVLTAADDRFWDDGPREALRSLTIRDSSGGVYVDTDTYFDCPAAEREALWKGCFGTPVRRHQNPFYEEYWIWASSWQEIPAWTELVCGSGQGFSLRLDWEAGP